MNDDLRQGVLGNASVIIERFGGIRPMASKMAVPVTTVQGWKKRGVIPENRKQDILHAASVHNIDLSDLDMSVHAANENLNAPTAAASATGYLGQDEFSKAPFASHAAGTLPDHDLLLREIRHAEQRAVRTSSFVSAMLAGAAALIAFFLLWPVKEAVDLHAQRLQALEQDVSSLREGQTALKDMMPADLRETFGVLQEKAQALQTMVSETGQQAERIVSGILGPTPVPIPGSAGPSQAGSRMAGSLAGLLDRLKTMVQ